MPLSKSAALLLVTVAELLYSDRQTVWRLWK